jgi:hypothetical protein
VTKMRNERKMAQIYYGSEIEVKVER